MLAMGELEEQAVQTLTRYLDSYRKSGHDVAVDYANANGVRSLGGGSWEVTNVKIDGEPIRLVFRGRFWHKEGVAP